jgi:hypothetical protein
VRSCQSHWQQVVRQKVNCPSARGSLSGIVTDTQHTLTLEAMGPEALKSEQVTVELVMSDQKPEAEDGLGQDIENSVADNLAVDGEDAGTITKGPDARLN